MDPLGNEDGIWYLSHLLNEWNKSAASSEEDRRIIDAEHYRIETKIASNDRLTATVDLTFRALRDGDRVLDFNLLPALRVTRVALSGNRDIGFIQERQKEDGSFYVILPEPAVKGQTYQVRIEYEGNKVLRKEGNGNFSVDARASWYPSPVAFGDRATYDLIFSVPKKYTLVGVGKLIKESKEGDYAVTEWKSDIPLAVAGFNYGLYKKKQRIDEKTGYEFEVYTTGEVPYTLRAAGADDTMSPSRMADNALIEALNSVRVFNQWFGESPYGRIAITQQPQFDFGQSWPTLVYLPVSAFLDATQRWTLLGSSEFSFFEFIQEVTPHEVSHQWWGHMVGWASFRDQWLSEGFADFSASLYLQATEPKPDKYHEFWERKRKMILEKNEYGRSPNDAGPLWMGLRLMTAKSEGAYNRLVYPKGAYVLHMLRWLMFDPKTGDQDFIDLMHDFVKTYSGRNASTEAFQRIVEKHMNGKLDLNGNGSMNWFFREWVFGTDIPRYRLDYTLKPGQDGKFVFTGKITQSGVSDAFKMRVPLYMDFDGNVRHVGSIVIRGNQTTQEFQLILPKKPKRILMNANHDILAAEAVAKEVSPGG